MVPLRTVGKRSLEEPLNSPAISSAVQAKAGRVSALAKTLRLAQRKTDLSAVQWVCQGFASAELCDEAAKRSGTSGLYMRVRGLVRTIEKAAA